jgi:hypothetical protein
MVSIVQKREDGGMEVMAVPVGGGQIQNTFYFIFVRIYLLYRGDPL